MKLLLAHPLICTVFAIIGFKCLDEGRIRNKQLAGNSQGFLRSRPPKIAEIEEVEMSATVGHDEGHVCHLLCNS